MNKWKRILEGVKNINEFLLGKYFFEFPTNETESLAKERAEICKGCKDFKQEKVKEFEVNDKNIPELSKRYCNACGCVLSYALRNPNKQCKKNKWQKVSIQK